MSGRRLIVVSLVAAALLVAGTGCGGKAEKKKPKKPAAAAVEKLPEVDPASAIVVDDGRLAVSSPKGWARGPRAKDCLVRYTPTPQKTYPSITITSADPPAGFAEVTAANHGDFVAAVSAGLEATFTQNGKSTLIKKPTPVTLGSHFGTAYTAPGQAKVGGLKEPIDRGCLALVVNGRLVTVEARAPKGKLDDEGRLAAKAVAAAVSAPKPAEPPPALGTEAESTPVEPAEPAAPPATPAAASNP